MRPPARRPAARAMHRRRRSRDIPAPPGRSARRCAVSSRQLAPRVPARIKRPRTIRATASSPPPSPCQKPEYRNGRRTKALLPPTSLVTSISARRPLISSRIVLPTIASTPSASTTEARVTSWRSVSRIACRRRTQAVSASTRSTSGSLRSSAASVFDRALPSPVPAAGRTLTTHGSGFSVQRLQGIADARQRAELREPFVGTDEHGLARRRHAPGSRAPPSSPARLSCQGADRPKAARCRRDRQSLRAQLATTR